MPTDVVIICTVCGDIYELEGVTFDDMRAAGHHPRRVHEMRGFPGLCPLHGGKEKNEAEGLTDG